MSADLTARVAELATRIEAELSADDSRADLAARVVDDWTDLALGVEVDAAFPHIDATAQREPSAASRRPESLLRRSSPNRTPTRSVTRCIPAREFSPRTWEGYDKPCDCGRDARVARLLTIIASEWQD